MAVVPLSRSPRVDTSDRGATSVTPEGRAGLGGVLPEVLHSANGFVIAAWKNIGLCVWTVQGTPALIDILEARSASFASKHPEGMSSIHIIAKNAPLPTAEAREHMQRIAKRYSSRLACVCHVVEGSGFWASALQGFLTGLHWITNGSFRLHICSDIATAARWVPAHHVDATKVPVGVAELEEAMRYVRRLAE